MPDSTPPSSAAASQSHEGVLKPVDGILGQKTSLASKFAVGFRFLGVLLFLYMFLVSIKAMGGGLKTYAQDPANEARIHALFDYAARQKRRNRQTARR